MPHQYAIGRGEDLVGYIDLVSEEAHAYRQGRPSDVIPLPEEYREREQTARREMLETLADFDDDLLEQLLEDQEPPQEQILRDLRKTLGADQVVPVFMGVADRHGRPSAARGACQGAPDLRPARLGVDGDGDAVVQPEELSPHAGKLSLARAVAAGGRDEPVGHACRASPAVRRPAAERGLAEAGEIVALARLDGARTGAVLTAGAAGATGRRRRPRPGRCTRSRSPPRTGTTR